MTISAAAKMLGVGRPALSNLLNQNASLSPEMALRMEKVFGASSEDLLKMQAAYDQAQVLEKEADIAVRAYTPGLLSITAIQIEAWSEKLSTRAELAVLLRKLVSTTGLEVSKLDFPSHENSQRKGWDGLVEAGVATPWIPKGTSGWEFGCNKDPKAKAEEDYSTRVKALAQSTRRKMTFVFVTPKNWPGKNAWVTSKVKKDEWKAVRAYDASDLEQWIEQSAPAQAWLAEHLPVGSNDIESLDRCWSRWADVSEPKLSKALFRKFVQSRGEALSDWLRRPPQGPFTVVGDSIEESLAFLACAFEGEALAKLNVSDRVIVLRSADALKKAANVSTNLIAVLASRDAENESAGLHRRVHTIVVTRRNAIDGRPDAVLDLVDSETFGTALTEMGLSGDRIERLARESGRSLTVLRRRLSQIPGIKRPPWTEDVRAAERLIPMVFVGAWSAGSEADQAVLSEMGAGTPEEIEKTIADLMAKDQSPVWTVGALRGVVSKLDSLYATHSLITKHDLERFFRVARVVLSETDPALDLPEERRWAANLFGKSRKHSPGFRQTLCETLVLLAVHGNNLFRERLGLDVEACVNSVIRELLTPLDATTWQSQVHDLSRYAEAAPKVFLDILEDDLRSGDPKVYALMRPAGSMFSSCPRTGLLWALEVLAWNPQWLSRVVLILAKLSELKIDDNWANTPENTLLSIFRSWMPQTAANLEQRIAALELLVKRNPDAGWRVCIDQFGLGLSVGEYSNRPRWRDDASGAGDAVQDGERCMMARKALDLALAWPFQDENTLGDLVHRLAVMTETDQLKVWNAVKSWAKSNPDDISRGKLRERIRRETMTRRGSALGVDRKLRDQAKATYEMLAPRDVVLRHQWLFADHWVEMSADELAGNFDFQAREERISQLRLAALREIWDEDGYDGIVRLCSLGKAASVVGSHLAGRVLDEQSAQKFIRDLVSDQTQAIRRNLDNCLFGLLAKLESEQLRRVLASMIERFSIEGPAGAVKIHRMLQCAPFGTVTWEFVDKLAPPERRKYWEEVIPYWDRRSIAELNRFVDELLIVGRPRAAFNVVQTGFRHLQSTTLVRLLRDAALSASESIHLDLSQYYISVALEELTGRSDIPREELARLEFAYIEILGHSEHGIPNLERELSESPTLFVQVLALAFRRSDNGEDPADWRPGKPENARAVATAAHKLLFQVKRIPGTREDGQIDPIILKDWLTQARLLAATHGRENIVDIVLGQWLARSPMGTDGVWPCEPVREVLEELGTAKILEGTYTGILNSRRAFYRAEGGQAERALANRYRDWSHSLANQFPFVARILEEVAATYDHDAVREDTETSIMRRLNC